MIPLLQSEYADMYRDLVSVVVIDAETGVIEFMTPRVEVMFGYHVRDCLVGEPVEILLPPHLRAAHARYRKELVRDPAPRAMGFREGLFGYTRDGHEFPVAVEFSFAKSKTDLRVKGIAVIVDLRGVRERVTGHA